MPPVQEKTGIVNSLKNIIKIFGGEDPPIEQGSLKTKTKGIIKDIYSASELGKLTSNNHTHGYTSNPSNEAAILLEYLKNISSHTKLSEDKLKPLLAIHPEIKRAKSIYVASVMSPNDLQSNLVKIVVDDAGLPENLQEAVEKYLDHYFNKEHKFGEKLAKYIGEYTYEKDAVCILMLPKTNIDDLSDLHDKIDRGEPLTVYQEDDQINWSNYTNNDPVLHDKMITEIATEAYGIYKPILDSTGKTIELKQMKELTETVVKVMNDSKALAITSDLTKVSAIKQTVDTKRTKKNTEILKRMYDTYQGIGTNILELANKDDERNLHPIPMKLPANCVIPLIAPGEPQTHLGYYVLLDQWINPVNIFDSYKTFSDDDDQLSKQAFFAMFSGSTLTAGINSIDAPDQRFRIIQSIFGMSMKAILREKVQKDAMVDLPTEEYDILSKFLFYQLLNKNRTTILYVPADLMIYYCDSYKEDGTGLSKTSSIEFILTVKTILLVSGVLGAMRAAIDKENIEVTLDDKETNHEQIIEVIRKTIIDKRALNFNTPNPASIARSMVDASLSITPKNIKGLNFEISRSKDGVAGDYRPPEDTLLDTITKLEHDNLGVPPSSLNNLDENEFMKSVLSNNLIFSNQIREVHAYLETPNHKYLSLFLRFSGSMQKELIELYRTVSGKAAPVDMDGKTFEDFKSTVTDEEKHFIRAIITNIRAVLPAPNIAITKSQFEDLQAEVEFIDLIVEALFDEAALGTDDEEIKSFYKTIGANYKANLLRKLIERSSYHNTIDIPDLEDVNAEELAKLIQLVLNKKEGVTKYIKALQDRIAANSEVTDPDNPNPSDDTSEEGNENEEEF